VFGAVFHLRLVVDTNFVIGDLLHLVTKRQNPNAKTALQEVLAAGAVVAYVPELLVVEVEAHFDELAAKHRVPVSRFQDEWREYRQLLRVVPLGSFDPIEGSSARGLRDPNDLAFLLTQEQVGSAAILSRDADIGASGVRVLSTLDCILDLRTYARSKSVELKIKIGGFFTITLGVAAIKALADAASSVGRAICGLPVWMKVLLLAALALPLLLPEARAWVSEKFDKLTTALGELWQSAAPVLLHLVDQLYLSESAAKAALEKVKAAVPRGAKLTMKVATYAVVVAADQPLHVKKIFAEVRAAGYVTQSKNPLPYLRRVLRSDSRLDEVEPDVWSLRAA
jgi:predicted nucleic acid-binding protein